MLRPIVVACLVLATVLAGCAQEARPVGSDDLRAVADARASRWNDDAELVGLAALDPGPGRIVSLRADLREAEEDLRSGRENGTLSAEEEDELEGEVAVLRAIVAAGGSRAGDGRAAVWTHAYRDAAGNGFLVTVDSGGVVDARAGTLEDEDEGMGPGLALVAWEIDSEEAAAAARAHDEDYARIEGGDNVTAFMVLLQGAPEDDEDGPGAETGDPYWILGLEDDQDDLVVLFVNARNGTVVSFTGLLEGLFLGREAGSEGGQFVAAIDAQERIMFTLQREHAKLAVQLALQPPAPEPVLAVVTGPDGRQERWEVAFAGGPRSEEAIVLEDAVAGEYVVELTASLAPYTQWEVGWCTDGGGLGFPFFMPPDACNEL